MQRCGRCVPLNIYKWRRGMCVSLNIYKWRRGRHVPQYIYISGGVAGACLSMSCISY